MEYSSAVAERRYSLVLRKRELENYAAVKQRYRMQAPPAESTARAPINVIAKDVWDRDPEQAGDD